MFEKRKKILVVDNNSEFRTAISVILENDDFQVFSSHDVSKCLEKVREVKPDLIILNVTMEEPDRIEHLMASLESDHELAAIPVLMVTPEEDQSIPRKSISAIGETREARLIRKPQNLIREVENLLRHRKYQEDGEERA